MRRGAHRSAFMEADPGSAGSGASHPASSKAKHRTAGTSPEIPQVGHEPAPLLEARGLRVVFADGREAVRAVELELRAGEVLGLVGPNGAGKSTLARSMAGLLAPSAGEVRLDGASIRSFRRRELARRIAYLAQDAPADLSFTAAEVVLMGRSPHLGMLGLDGAADRQAAWEALGEVGATALADRPMRELSGGERRRVLLARIVAQRAPVWILDEPTTHLDLAHQHLALRLARIHADRGGSTLCVLHDITQAHACCDRVAVLEGGTIRAMGPPESVLRPDLLGDVFGVRFVEVIHPETGRPHLFATPSQVY